MSGSFYSLNTQYNTLLAILEDINQDKLAQDLENVLTEGNDAAGLNMTNVGAITVGTLNYTTLNPAVPAVIGNISQVLAVGNDATNQSITNMGSVELKAGGGGSITYADGTVQSTAYTGSAGGDQNIQQVLAEGSDAGGQQISNILGLSTGSVATNPSNALTLLSLNTNNINLTAFPTASASSGQVVIQTQELGGSQNNWYFTNNGDFDLPQGCSINYPSGSGLDEYVGQIDLTAVGADLNLNATGVGGINLNSATTTLSGTLTFPDASVQTTAFTGTASTPNLSAVLTAGNSVGSSSINMNQQSITNPNQISTLLTTSGVFDPSVQNQINNVWSNSTTQTNNYFKLGYLTGGKSGFPRPTADIQLTGGLVLPNAYTSGELIISGSVFSTTSPSTNNYYTKLSQQKLSFYTDIDPFYNYIMPNVAASIESNTALTLDIGASNFVFNTNGSITFPDASVQSTAYTGGGSENLTTVLTTGNNAGNLQITNLAGVAGTTYFIGDVGNDTLLSNGTGGSFNFYTGSGGGITQATVQIDQAGIELFIGDLNLGDGNLLSVGSIICDNALTLSSAPSSNWVFNTDGSLTYPDNTVQYTAYTGTAGGDQGLSSVLGVSNDGGGLNMTNLGNLSSPDWTIGVFPSSSPDTYITNQNTQGTLFLNTTGFGAAGGVQSLALDYQTANFGVSVNMNNNFIEGINSLIANAVDIIYTDGAENITGTGVVLLGTGMGTIGNYAVGMGTNVTGGNGTLSANAVGIGYNAGYYGIGQSSVAIGQGAGSQPSMSSQTGQGTQSVAIGLNAGASGIGTGGGGQGADCIAIGAGSGAGNGNNPQISGAVAIGSGAGGFGMNANSVAIGYAAGKGTLASVPQGQNSIAIGPAAGAGFGSAGVPANSFVVSSMRSAASATNQLTYNTTTKEIQYAPSAGSAAVITYAQATFTNQAINNGAGSQTFTSGAEALFIPTAGTWQVSGWYRLASSVAGIGLQLNGSSFYMATQSGDPYEYGQLSSHFYEIFTSTNTSLTFTHNISYTMTTAIPLVLSGRITTGGFNPAVGTLNGQGEFYAIKLA